MISLAARIALVGTLLLTSRAWADDAAPDSGQATPRVLPLAVHGGLLFPYDGAAIATTGTPLYNLGIRYDFGRVARGKPNATFSLTVDGFAERGRSYLTHYPIDASDNIGYVTGRMAGAGAGLSVRHYIFVGDNATRAYIGAGVDYYLMRGQNGDNNGPPYSMAASDLGGSATLGIEFRSGMYAELSECSLPTATATPSELYITLGDRIPGVSPGKAASVDHFLERVRLSYGRYRFNHGEYDPDGPRIDEYGTADGVSLDMIQGRIVSHPATTSLYFDAVLATNDLRLDGVVRQRTMHGYGIEECVSLPRIDLGSVRNFRPYVGVGLGEYRQTEDYTDYLFGGNESTKATRLGGKVMAGIEWSHIFVEGSYTKPGWSSTAGRDIRFGVRL